MPATKLPKATVRANQIAALYERKRAIHADMEKLHAKEQASWSAEDGIAWQRMEADFSEIDVEIDKHEREVALEAAATHFPTEEHRDDLELLGVGQRRTASRQTADKRNHQFATPDGRRLQTRSWNQPLVQHASDEDINLGRFFRGMVMNDHSQLSEFERRTLLGGSDTQGGYLLPSRISSAVIDLARSASVAMKAGAQTLPMDTPSMKIVRQTSDPTMHWRPEGATVAASEPAFDVVNLVAKTISCIVPLSVEILEDVANIEQVVNSAIMGALGLAIDQAILAGTGVSDPLGLRNLGTLNAIASVGVPTNYDEVSNAIGDIRLANFPGDNSDLAWIRHPTIGDIYSNLKTGITNDNTPLPIPQRVSELQLLETTSIAVDEGAGSDEQYSIVGDFSQVIVGMRTNMNIRVATDGTVGSVNGTTDLVRFLVMHARLDVACVRPTWLTLLSGITLA